MYLLTIPLLVNVIDAFQLIDRHNEPLPMSAIDFVLNINLRGTLDFVRQCLPMMVKTEPSKPDGERGVIILVSSSAAYDGQPGQVGPSSPTIHKQC